MALVDNRRPGATRKLVPGLRAATVELVVIARYVDAEVAGRRGCDATKMGLLPAGKGLLSAAGFLVASTAVALDVTGAFSPVLMGGTRVRTAAAVPGREEDADVGPVLVAPTREVGRVTGVGLVEREAAVRFLPKSLEGGLDIALAR